MDIPRPSRTSRRRRLYLIGGLAAACLLVGVSALAAWIGPALPDVDRSSLWIGTVKRGDMLRQVRASGVLASSESRWRSAATTAQVERIDVLPGARVQPDTVLMELSNPEVEDALRNARAEVAAARADVAAKRAALQSQLLDERSALAQARSDYASAKVKAEANAKAMKLNLIPRVEYEQGRIALAALKQRMDIEQQRVDSFAGTMRAQMDAVRAHLQQQLSNQVLRQRQADALRVRAGISGVLQEVAVQEGQQVEAGAKLARVTRTGSLLARLQVPEIQAKDVALGMPVRVDTHNGIVQGTVARIDPVVHEGSVSVDVHLTGKLPDSLRPDQSVDGLIRVARLDDVLSVGRPQQASSQARIHLYRLDPGGDTATLVPVQVGAVSADRIQVLSGLRAGDRVILSDTSRWDGHSRLRLK